MGASNGLWWPAPVGILAPAVSPQWPAKNIRFPSSSSSSSSFLLFLPLQFDFLCEILEGMKPPVSSIGGGYKEEEEEEEEEGELAPCCGRHTT